MSSRRQRISKIIISIVIAVALLVALKLFGGSFLLQAKAKSAMKQASSIHQALFAISQHNDQQYPNTNFDGSAAQTSNDAFRQLFIEGFVDDERIFYVQGCAWHAGKLPDGDIGTQERHYSAAVSKNENHWAYVSGLNSTTSAPETPLLMDGCSETVGFWADDPSKKGGIWKGRYLAIVYVGGNARVGDLKEETDFPARIREDVRTTPEAKLLNPDG